MLMHNKMVNCITDMVLDYITEPVLIPLPLEDPDSSEVIDVSCGRAHTVVLTSEGGEYQQYLGIVLERGEYQQYLGIVIVRGEYQQYLGIVTERG